VYHIVNIRVLIEHLVQRNFIGDVKFIEFRPLPADEFDAVDDFLGRVVEVVNNDDLVIGLEKS
jgi:hypothetical protein